MKRFLMKALPLIISLSSSILLFGQTVQDVNGKVYQVKSETEITGSPYLFAEFLNGEIFLHGAHSIKDVPLNFDAVDQLLLFKNGAGQTSVADWQIDSVTVNDHQEGKEIKRVFKNGYPETGNFNSATFYEVLLDGELKFLKKVNKYIIEKTGYNSAAKGSELKEKVFYFIVRKGNVTAVTKNQKSVLGVFGQNTEGLKQQVTAQKLNLKDEDDIIKFLAGIASALKK